LLSSPFVVFGKRLEPIRDCLVSHAPGNADQGGRRLQILLDQHLRLHDDIIRLSALTWRLIDRIDQNGQLNLLDSFDAANHNWRSPGETPMTSAIHSGHSSTKLVIRDTIVSRVESARSIIPGVALAGAIALAANLLHGAPGAATFSPMILAITIGIAMRNLLGTPSFAGPGIAFSMRRLLRSAIVLLGLQITLTQLAAVGATGLFIVTATLVATFGFTLATGRALGVDRRLTELIAAGTSICGASAVVATNSVTEASDEDVAYAIACVTIFGSIAMFVYPVLPSLLHLDGGAYGLWSGASIHEIAQVAAASFQNGQRAGEIATIAKLARVILLAPVVVALSIASRGSARRAPGASGRPPLPWFAIGFVAVAAINSVVTIPADLRSATVTLSTFLLTIALAAMGLETDVSRLYAKGLRPAILGGLAFLFIATFSLTLIKLMG
jgi:uncharacterized integral membrane protein (TIGR00698 family)